MAPIASVIMSVWNGQTYLDQAISSVLSQSFADLEFVIVDDGSTDETPAILARHAEIDSRIRIFTLPHGGMVRSFNFAADQSVGEYLVHLDADDVALPHRIERQVAFMAEHPEVGFSGTANRMIWPDGRTILEKVYPADDAAIRLELMKSCCFCHSSIIVRKELFAAAGGYRPAFMYAEDLDLYLRLADYGKMANLDQILVLYRIHGNQVCARNVEQQIRSSIGVRTAARLRSQGQSEEILLQEEGITRETLRSAGVTDEEIDRRTLGALEHHLRLAMAAERPAGFEKEVQGVVARVREFCGRCATESLNTNDLPLITKVLGIESYAQAASPLPLVSEIS
jgi:hypothetical protein